MKTYKLNGFYKWSTRTAPLSAVPLCGNSSGFVLFVGSWAFVSETRRMPRRMKAEKKILTERERI